MCSSDLVAGVAFALASVLRAVEQRGHTVHVSYTAPAGPLRVRLLGPSGEAWRRVEFSAAAERTHDVDLPTGAVTAELSLGGETRTRGGFVADETDVLTFDWGR